MNTKILRAKDQREIPTKNTRLGRCPHCNAIATLHKKHKSSKSECICCGKIFLWDR